MGSCGSSLVDVRARYRKKLLEEGRISELQDEFSRAYSFPVAVQVAHFTPSSFPINPKITPAIVDMCEASWELIVNDTVGITTGLTKFYMEFYRRLSIVDSNGRFEAHLARNIKDNESKFIAKGSILVRIIRFSFSIRADNDASETALYMLGKVHHYRGIRPWQYAIFIETLLQTISHCLGREATNEVMHAWVNLFAFILKGMLPTAIHNLLVETELSVNTSCAYYGGSVLEEIRSLEESRAVSNNSFSISIESRSRSVK